MRMATAKSKTKKRMRSAFCLLLAILVSATLSWPYAFAADQEETTTDATHSVSYATVNTGNDQATLSSVDSNEHREGVVAGDVSAGSRSEGALEGEGAESDGLTSVESAEDAGADTDAGVDSDQTANADADAGVSVSVASLAANASAAQSNMAAVYAEHYSATTGMPSGEQNEWQVVRENYSSVKAGDGTYSYSSDGAVRVQKAVLPTDTENKFQIYLNVEPQLSWTEFFKSLDNYASHNKASSFNPNSGATKLLSQDEYDALTATQKTYYEPINVRYKLPNGSTSEVVRYGNFHDPDNKKRIRAVPNGSYCWSSQKFSKSGLVAGINWSELVSAAGNGEELFLDVDASSVASQFSFADDSVYPHVVTDPMGQNIIYQGLVSADKGTVDEPEIGSTGGTLTWTLPTADYPALPYLSTSTGTGTLPGTSFSGPVTELEGVKEVEIDGKQTAFYTDVLEMRYEVSLDVASSSFESCAYPNNTPSAIAINDTNGATTVLYDVGTETRAPHYFPIPAVKGLLYDFEFLKIDENSGEGLAGATFTLLNGVGEVVLDENGQPITATSQADGSVKFRNLPWGTYSAVETTPPPGYSLGSSPRTVGPYVLCWTTNKTLIEDHSGTHDADLASDQKNMTVPSAIDKVTNRKMLGLGLLKRDEASHQTLSGVGFSLRVDNGDGSYAQEDPEAAVWADSGSSIPGGSGFTDADGKLYFYGLEPGTYWLVETYTLAGYKLLDKPIEITVDNDYRVFFYENNKVEVTPDDNNVVHITVDNKKIPILPSSGSSGGLVLGVAGVAFLLIAAAIALMSQVRRLKSGVNH